MKKKTIVFICLAVLFLLSAFSGLSSGNISGGVGCLILCVLFAFLAYRNEKNYSQKSISTVANNFPVSPSNNDPVVYKLELPAACDNYEYLTISLISDLLDSDNATPQYNLTCLYFHDERFSDGLNPELTCTEYKGKPSFRICVNDLPIGFIPETYSQQIFDNRKRIVAVKQIKIICIAENTYSAEVTLALKPAFEIKEIKVAGVTFKNDDGKLRQTILRKISFREAPYDDYLDVSLRDYLYENELAYAVYVNGSQIGSIPKSEISFIHDNLSRICDITVSVYGGGRNQAGYAISYGAALKIKLKCVE